MPKGEATNSQDGTSTDARTTTPRAQTPEPIGPEVVDSMHKRALQLKETLSKGKGKETALEHELIDMVLRGTSYAIQLQTQLHDQAESIALLIRQRQFLLDRHDEERELWKVEREGWDRTAEALLSQVNKATPTFYREHEVNRQTAMLDAENLTLRIKLSDAQTRLSTAESELAQLKPILLMQPYALVHSDVPKHRKKKRDGADLGSDIIEEVAPVDDDLQPSPERKPKGQYYRQREQVPPFIYSPRKVGSSSTSRSRTTMADARSEHLLLAARKIGKQRASILSAMNYYQPVDAKSGSTPAAVPSTSAKGKGRAEDGGLTFTEYIPKIPTTPKTPQKSTRPPVLSPNIPPPFMNASPGFTSMVQPYAYVPGTVPGPAYALYSPSGYTYPAPPPLNSPSRPVGGASTSNGKLSSSSASISTPSSARRTATTAQPPSSPSKGGPSTPFDKLISAARSVLSPATTLDTPTKKQAATQNRSTGRRLPSPDNDGSPTPKRRRVQGAASQQTQGESNLGRTASALDVLADQAAVFGSNSRKSGDALLSATERNGESSQGNSAPVVDVGGSRSVFSTADPFVPHTKAAQKKPRTRAPRKALEPAAKLSRAPKRGKAQVTQTAQSARSRTQSPANVALNNASWVPEEDARTDASRHKTRSPSVNSNSAAHRAGEEVAAADDTASNRASTPGQDDMRQRWLAKLGR